MTDTKDDDLVKLLREVSLEKQQEAWARSDGGQYLTIGAMLADEAADRIEELEAKLAKAVEALEAGVYLDHKTRRRGRVSSDRPRHPRRT
jgi:hypothetical protein